MEMPASSTSASGSSPVELGLDRRELLAELLPHPVVELGDDPGERLLGLHQILVLRSQEGVALQQVLIILDGLVLYLDAAALFTAVS